MRRWRLSDELWSKLREILLHLAVYDKRDLRLTVEGILYRMRTACPWRDLPEAFGAWNKVYKRFNAWSASDIWRKVFEALVVEPDMDRVFIDGTSIKAH
jgi:transposase